MSRLAQIETMLTKDPDDVFLNFSLAMEFRASGEIDRALAQFDRVIALDPGYLAAYMRKGEVLMKEKQFDTARATLEQGIAVAKQQGDNHMVDNINEMLEMLP
jgi:tetratricopeptide (TPR) repeat protein